jgi:phosphate transport system permease protein|tara:strand:- start:20342 stop:21697 length:1356 start_codon:yes stop_codon:yes gene_type:complete
LIIVAGLLSFTVAKQRAVFYLQNNEPLRSMPIYHGLYVSLWSTLLPIFFIILLLFFKESYLNYLVIPFLSEETIDLGIDEILYVKNFLINNISSLSTLIGSGFISEGDANLLVEKYQETRVISFSSLVLLSIILSFISYKNLSVRYDARRRVERILKFIFFVFSTIAVLTTVGIIFSLIFETLRFFSQVGFIDFVFGTHWSPQTAIREDQVGSSGSFGAIPLFTGTLLITAVAMSIAAPLGLYSAIFLSQYAKPKTRDFLKPILEILAGIPTVVYGFFAALTVGPFVRSCGEYIGLTVATESALAAGLVMGVMIIPYVSSLSDDVMTAVPLSLRDGSLALGATKAETVKKVIIPAALPGIVSALLLAISRAIGETMIVVMAAGLAANLTANPLSAVTTVTVQIVTLLVGDQEFDSAKTLAAFALGLMLFVITLALNVFAMIIVRRYRERYE